MPSPNGAMPPMLMFRSFLTIASGVVVHWFMVSGITIAVANAWFPEYVNQLIEAKQQGQTMDAAVVFGAMPRGMFWAVVAIVTPLSILLGMFTAWSAPFGRLVHATFLSVIIGVNLLSQSIGAPPEQKAVMMTHLAFFPIAIFVGGYLANHWMANADSNAAIGSPMLE